MKTSRTIRLAYATTGETTIFSGTTNATPRFQFRTAQAGTILGWVPITDITFSGTTGEEDVVNADLTLDVDPVPTWLASGTIGYYEIIDRNGVRHHWGTSIGDSTNVSDNPPKEVLFSDRVGLAVTQGDQILFGSPYRLTFSVGSF